MLFILIAAVIIFTIDGIPLIKKRRWAELTICVLVLLLACVLFIAKDAGIVPLKLLGGLLSGIGKKLFG